MMSVEAIQSDLTLEPIPTSLTEFQKHTQKLGEIPLKPKKKRKEKPTILTSVDVVCETPQPELFEFCCHDPTTIHARARKYSDKAGFGISMISSMDRVLLKCADDKECQFYLRYEREDPAFSYRLQDRHLSHNHHMKTA